MSIGAKQFNKEGKDLTDDDASDKAVDDHLALEAEEEERLRVKELVERKKAKKAAKPKTQKDLIKEQVQRNKDVIDAKKADGHEEDDEIESDDLKDCPICNHKERETIEEQLIKGNLSKKAVARQLVCDVTMVIDHIDGHPEVRSARKLARIERKKRATAGMAPVDVLGSKKDVIVNTMLSLTEAFEDLAEMGIDRKDIGNVVKLSKEIRNSTMDLAQLEGELKEEINITNSQLTEFLRLTVEELCPECRKKIMDKMGINIPVNETYITVPKIGADLPEDYSGNVTDA